MNSYTQMILQKLVGKTQEIELRNNQSLSLLIGLPGRLLFHWYAAKSQLISVDIDRFEHQLTQLSQSASSFLSDHSFGYGLAGFGWFMELLLTERSDGYDPDFNQDVEDILTSSLSRFARWPGEIEHVLGLSGIAIFAARRFKQGRGIELYGNIVRLLDNLAIYEQPNKYKWSAPENSVYRVVKGSSEPEYNLGLAHGVPAIICALLPATSLPGFGDKAKKLILGGCNWLVEQQFSDAPANSCFSCRVDDVAPSRLGWCYGDLTIALTLARVGQTLERQDLVDEAKRIGLHAARRDENSAMVKDAGICHGSAGLMLIFQMLNEIIPMPEFEKASDYWLENTIVRFKENGIEGFYANKAGNLIEETGLLEGYSGVGLCLLARQGISPDWADALLLA